MVIIKHGTAYEELDSYSCTCPKCNCEFEYVIRDVNSYLNEECYVICPECFSDVKLPYEGVDGIQYLCGGADISEIIQQKISSIKEDKNEVQC